MAREETARHWRHPGMPGVDLLRARYVTHTFARHTHETYTIGLVEHGVEEWRNTGSLVRAGVGGMPVVNPGTVHTGHAGVPEGWTYRVLYPSVSVMSEVAAELGMGRGTPYFPEPVVYDPVVAMGLRAAHDAAERGDALAADTLTRLFFAGMLAGHGHGRVGSRGGVVAPGTSGARAARRARNLLETALVDPPSLAELATAVGASPFALLRAFRAEYGLPPHAWLTQRRVSGARRLLEAGTAPADVAQWLGFVDQAHLSRHFRRTVGVPPGAYQRERKNVQDG